MVSEDMAGTTDLSELASSVLEGRQPVDPALRAEFERLIATSVERVRAACRQHVRDPQRAEELAQEALLVAYRKLPEYEGRSKLSTWVIGIAKNLARNEARKRGELLTEDGVLDTGDEAISALRSLSRAEREQAVTEASACLDPVEQEAVYLRYVEGLPRDEIDTLLGDELAARGFAKSGTRGLLQSCKRKLQDSMKTWLEDHGHGTSFLRTRM